MKKRRAENRMVGPVDSYIKQYYSNELNMLEELQVFMYQVNFDIFRLILQKISRRITYARE